MMGEKARRYYRTKKDEEEEKEMKVLATSFRSSRV
jgi:hypothetical protein